MSGPDALLPFEHDEARRIAAPALDLDGADGVEVFLIGSRSGLTRFAASEIIQNTVRHTLRVHVRVGLHGRSATATTDRLDPGGLRQAAEFALAAARTLPDDPDYPGLAAPAEVGIPKPAGRVDEATATAAPARRAEAVSSLVAACAPAKAAGIFETGSHSFAVISTRGIDCFDGYSRCNASCLADAGESTGWAETSCHSMASVDVEALARRAGAKAEMGRRATDVIPGRYEVVLEAPAVALLVEYLAYSGFGAKQVIEGESFMATRTGERVAADAVTIFDDAHHPMSVGIGFDFEGVPRESVPVIEAGVARTPVSDRRTARKLGTESTGHGSGSNELGPFPFNLVMAPGTDMPDQLIGGVKDGLLITRFHYVNVLDRPEALLTGMTRDGTFRIRDGEIAEPVRNLRFADSALTVLDSVVAIGSDLFVFPPDWGGFGSTVVPPVRAAAFNFTSATSH